MSRRILECVPNFSEGRDPDVLAALADAVRSVPGAYLLDVDPGRDANRTVYTFAGAPEAVVEAAFRAVAVAVARIDMRKHQGTHPRLGAADVVPLVPVSGITMAETVVLAQQLAQRVAAELDISVYLYEQAALRPERRLLADVRAGEYEGLAAKLAQPDGRPDFGPASFRPRSGASIIGARDFLAAFNVNLNTRDVRLARAIAAEVRETGRILPSADEGQQVRVPGLLPAVRAIGWYMPEYGVAQVSMNLTNLHRTPLHTAFDTVDAAARQRGLRVTGSELIGLLPQHVLVQAGRHYLLRQGASPDVPEDEAIFLAAKTLGLGELRPFDPAHKLVERLLAAAEAGRLPVPASGY